MTEVTATTSDGLTISWAPERGFAGDPSLVSRARHMLYIRESFSNLEQYHEAANTDTDRDVSALLWHVVNSEGSAGRITVGPDPFWDDLPPDADRSQIVY